MSQQVLKKKICVIISPLEKGVVLYLYKLEFPSPRDALLSLVEIGPMVLEKKIFKFYLPLEKGVALYLNKL